eukprot:1177309-Prorocentrum_minimum.AAC.4
MDKILWRFHKAPPLSCQLAGISTNCAPPVAAQRRATPRAPAAARMRTIGPAGGNRPSGHPPIGRGKTKTVGKQTFRRVARSRPPSAPRGGRQGRGGGGGHADPTGPRSDRSQWGVGVGTWVDVLSVGGERILGVRWVRTWASIRSWKIPSRAWKEAAEVAPAARAAAATAAANLEVVIDAVGKEDVN